jgi:hypothetical protein
MSGTSGIITTLLGYLMLLLTDKFINSPLVVRSITYWSTVFFLIADPLNISIGPFIYGGDALGVAKGLEIPVLLVQGVAFIVLLINSARAKVSIESCIDRVRNQLHTSAS